MTLEDETGFVNVVLWKQIFEDFALLAKTASLLGVSGRLEAKDGVTHLIAETLWAPSLQRDVVRRGSRDFH
jgi:error-prone DNA polymerase